MTRIVIDTDVFSFFFKRDTRAQFYAPDLAGAQPCLSFQTVAELQSWAISRGWGAKRRQQLSDVIRHYLVFPSDEAMVRLWAEVTAHRRALGHEVACGDAWIAATALRHGATLMTHNAKDYADIPNLTIISRGP